MSDGLPDSYRAKVLDRLAVSYIRDVSTGCWVWSKTMNKTGYGTFYYAGKNRLAHRATYELLVGSIPLNLGLDHLCRVRACVNPGHLEPVTQRENVLRGVSRAAANAAKTHCQRGHKFTDENTLKVAKGRACRTCHSNWRLYKYGPDHARRPASPTHCSNGHEYTAENLRIGGRKRICRECQRRWRRESYARRRLEQTPENQVAPGGAVTPTGGMDAEGACNQ